MKISVASPDGTVTFEQTIKSTKQLEKAASNSGNKVKSTDKSNATSVSFKKALETSAVADKLSTTTAYKDIFIEASKKYGVSYDLLTAMAQQESGFSPNAVSKSGAMGIMQIMPQTAEELGLTNPFDAYDNIMAGANYIAQKLDQFDGDLDKALAAYNAGATTVKEYDGVPPIEETQNYVKNIKAIMSRGADIPYRNYISKDASKEAVQQELKELLSNLPDSDEYDALKNVLAEINYI